MSGENEVLKKKLVMIGIMADALIENYDVGDQFAEDLIRAIHTASNPDAGHLCDDCKISIELGMSAVDELKNNNEGVLH
jgi:hypothetical protein